MGYFLVLIGLVTFVIASIYMLSANNSMHQIFAQLQYVTCAVLIGSGAIINSVDSLKETFEDYIVEQKEAKKTNKEL